RDEPEIFGDERQASESSPRLLEEIPARHDGELALACRRGARGHLPAAVKADEVIEANGVEAVECVLEPRDPPFVVRLGERLPVVDRVSPELSVGAEVVGRHTGEHAAFPAFVELEHLAVLPDVGAVVSDVHRHVSEQEHALLRAVLAELGPLPIERELQELLVRNFSLELAASTLHCATAPKREVGLPGRPRAVPVRALERPEQGEAGQPTAIPFAEALELRLEIALRARAEALARATQ